MKNKLNYKIENNIYYQKSPDKFMKLIQLIENHSSSYGQMLRAKGKTRFLQTHPDYVSPYKSLYDWINESVPLLADEYYHISTKCFWILNGIVDFPQCSYKGCTKKFIKNNVQVNGKYPKFCRQHCKCDPSTIEKRKNTCRKHFGTDFPMQSDVIKEKQKQTNLKNLGYSSPLACPKCRQLGKKTRLEKYNDENWSNHEKASKTFKQHVKDDPTFIPSIRKKIQQTNINNGHDKNWTNRKKSVETRLNNHNGIYWTDEMLNKSNNTKDMHRQENPNYDKDIQNKIEQTNLDTYGVKCTLQSQQVKDKLNQWIIEHGGTTNVFQTDYAKTKSRNTMIKNHGAPYSMQSSEIKAKYDFDAIHKKGDETKRNNGTFNTSKPEDDAYNKLKAYFGNEDVVRQYHSEKYPFNCDFYIKSKDLYIECNYNWTHGGHWFDPLCENDQNTLKKWQDKGTNFYKNAIETWTIRDPKKKNTAQNNSLNYLVFWNPLEFDQWLQQLVNMSN